MWYAAHVILLMRFTDGVQDIFPVWENIILINAADANEAWEKAERTGNSQAITDGRSTFKDRLFNFEFVGIRKLLICDDPFDPDDENSDEDGTEITYSSYTLDSEESLIRLVNDEPVSLICVFRAKMNTISRRTRTRFRAELEHDFAPNLNSISHPT